MEELWGKIKNSFINNIFIIIVALACLAYILYGLIDVNESGKSITQILMDGAIAFLFATFIIKLFDIDALKRGGKIPAVLAKKKEHEDMANEVAQYCDLLDDWCVKKNKLAYTQAKTRILETVGIKYSDYENHTIDYNNLTKHQKQAIRKADKVKITKLSTNYLLAETSKTNDPHNIGRSKIDYERNVEFTSMFSRVATMVIAGYYSVDLITSASLMELLWAFVQVVFFLLMGGLRWGKTYMYMNDEYPNFINGKINFLKEFQIAVKNNELELEKEPKQTKIIIKNLIKKEKNYDKERGRVVETNGTTREQAECNASIETAKVVSEQCCAEPSCESRASNEASRANCEQCATISDYTTISSSASESNASANASNGTVASTESNTTAE